MIRPSLMLISILCMMFFTNSIVGAKDDELAGVFKERNISGTIIISSLSGTTEYIHNKRRAKKPFLPASTFKIPNTLIALAENAIADENEIIKWDGRDKGWDPWNKDQSLKTALPISCVWFYQELAKRVGNSKYLYHLDKMNYGNKLTGLQIKTFWLEGDIKISAIQQINFLKKIYKNELPYQKKHLQLLKELMIVEKTPNYIIRAKTGTAARLKNKHGWYVGYVEARKEVWFFATNIEIKKKSDSKYRKEITMVSLQLKNII